MGNDEPKETQNSSFKRNKIKFSQKKCRKDQKENYMLVYNLEVQ